MQRRQFHSLLTAGSQPAHSFRCHHFSVARAASSPDPAAAARGGQKGGLRALLEAAGELQNIAYDIRWSEFPAAAPLAAGSRVKAFAANRSDPYGTAIPVAPDSPLKGKIVATNRGSIGHFVTPKALASVGLKQSDIDLRFLPPPDAKLALTQGSVDAWATW